MVGSPIKTFHLGVGFIVFPCQVGNHGKQITLNLIRAVVLRVLAGAVALMSPLIAISLPAESKCQAGCAVPVSQVS